MSGSLLYAAVLTMLASYHKALSWMQSLPYSDRAINILYAGAGRSQRTDRLSLLREMNEGFRFSGQRNRLPSLYVIACEYVEYVELGLRKRSSQNTLGLLH